MVDDRDCKAKIFTFCPFTEKCLLSSDLSVPVNVENGFTYMYKKMHFNKTDKYREIFELSSPTPHTTSHRAVKK